jgi:hypothetical protein
MWGFIQGVINDDELNRDAEIAMSMRDSVVMPKLGTLMDAVDEKFSDSNGEETGWACITARSLVLHWFPGPLDSGPACGQVSSYQIGHLHKEIPVGGEPCKKCSAIRAFRMTGNVV